MTRLKIGKIILTGRKTQLHIKKLQSNKMADLQREIQVHLSYVSFSTGVYFSNVFIVCLFVLEFYGPVNNEVPVT